MEKLSESEKEYLKICEFLECFKKIEFKPFSIYNYYQVKIKSNTIYILDDEEDSLKTVKSYKEFLSWFMFELVNESYRSGQENLRKAIKELVGLSV